MVKESLVPGALSLGSGHETRLEVGRKHDQGKPCPRSSLPGEWARNKAGGRNETWSKQKDKTTNPSPLFRRESDLQTMLGAV